MFTGGGSLRASARDSEEGWGGQEVGSAGPAPRLEGAASVRPVPGPSSPGPGGSPRGTTAWADPPASDRTSEPGRHTTPVRRGRAAAVRPRSSAARCLPGPRAPGRRGPRGGDATNPPSELPQAIIREFGANRHQSPTASTCTESPPGAMPWTKSFAPNGACSRLGDSRHLVAPSGDSFCNLGRLSTVIARSSRWTRAPRPLKSGWLSNTLKTRPPRTQLTGSRRNG